MAGLRGQLAKRIRELRVAAGLTQQGLADKARLDWKYVGSIERAEKNPSIEVVEKLIHAFGLQPHEFFRFTWSGPLPSASADEILISKLLQGAAKATRTQAIALVKHLVQVSRPKRR